MISNFQLQQCSSLPWLELQITTDGRLSLYQQASSQGCAQNTTDPNALDLSDLWSVHFLMFKAGRTRMPVGLSGSACVVVDPERGITAKDGIVRYRWSQVDTSVPGLYYGQFVLTFKDQTVLKWPYQIESLAIEVMEGNSLPIPPPPKPYTPKDLVNIVIGVAKKFKVKLFYSDTGEPYPLLGSTEIVVTMPGASAPVVETLTGGRVAVTSVAGEIEVTVPSDDSALLEPNGSGGPYQNLQVSVTIAGPADDFILVGVLNILTQV